MKLVLLDITFVIKKWTYRWIFRHPWMSMKLIKLICQVGKYILLWKCNIGFHGKRMIVNYLGNAGRQLLIVLRECQDSIYSMGWKSECTWIFKMIFCLIHKIYIPRIWQVSWLLSHPVYDLPGCFYILLWFSVVHSSDSLLFAIDGKVRCLMQHIIFILYYSFLTLANFSIFLGKLPIAQDK